MTYHRAWRDLVKDLETGDQEGQSGSDPDDEKEGNDQDQDQDQDGEAGATAEAPAEAVIHEEPEHPATGADAVPEPGTRVGLPVRPLAGDALGFEVRNDVAYGGCARSRPAPPTSPARRFRGSRSSLSSTRHTGSM